MANYWMVRSAENIRDLVEEGKFVAIGFGGAEINDISDSSRDEIRKRVALLYPDAKSRTIDSTARQLYRFKEDIQIGDRVITGVGNRQYLIGRITGNYWYEKKDPDHSHRRSVEWYPRRVERDEMTPYLRNSLGSLMTLFQVTKHEDEISRLLDEVPPTHPGTECVVSEETEEFTEIGYAQNVEAEARERIEDLILNPRRFDGHEFEGLVAALLKAMGFRIVRPPERAADGGIDIIAAPDVFGFEQPRIIVQVKHRRSRVGLDDVQRLKGTLRAGEKGLFVSTGGFASGVEKQAGPDITLLDGQKIVEYFIDYYENISSEYKAKVPLKRVYLPVPPDEMW